MREGVWHQFGDRSQRLALEQLEQGVGVGVIMSPRDIAPHLAKEYASRYRSVGAEVAIDPQFHVVGTSVGKLKEWGFNKFRTSVSTLGKISPEELDQLTVELRIINAEIGADFVIAPSLVHESGRRDTLEINRKLYRAAKRAGDDLGIPTIGTIIIGRSAGTADTAFLEALSDATAVGADGWYYAFEFADARIPSDASEVRRAASGCLRLAASGVPVLQGFAGPLALVGAAAGATGVAIGHSQNLWQFTRARWEPSAGAGGGGNAPARLYSRSLWGTIVYPDEISLLSEPLAGAIVEESPFIAPLAHREPFSNVQRWEAGKHLVWVIGDEVQRLFALQDHRARCDAAIKRLTEAVKLHSRVSSEGIVLKDDSASYQFSWTTALRELQKDGEDDFMALELLQ